MKKIVFGITSLAIGGAEKTLIDLCNKLCDKYTITIFTLYNHGEFEKQLQEKVNIISLYKTTYKELSSINKKLESIRLFLTQKYIYKKYIKGKFDIEIAFLEGPITNLFKYKNKEAKKIAWVHTDISLIFGNGIKAKIKKLINKQAYTKYDKIIFVSQSSLDSFNKEYLNKNNTKNKKNNKQKIKKENQLIINNYINPEYIINKSNEKIDFEFNGNTINFLSVARLVEAKALDRLIEIHYKLINDGFMHKIYIVGDRSIKNYFRKFNKKIKNRKYIYPTRAKNKSISIC